MKKYPKVFIIVLNFNGKDVINECLRSIFTTNYPNFEVVVVDNKSNDGSLEIVKKFFSRYHLIANPSNLGFSAGNNVGIRFALEKMADYVFLLNNDAFLEKNTLLNLVEEAEKHSEIGLISPLIINKNNGNFWFAGGKINWLQMRTQHLINFDFSKKTLFESQYLSGCALLIKQKVFQKIGLFDENFFLYYEDADFSFRARKKGFHLAVCPRAIAYHAEKSEQNKNNKIYWLVVSGIIFFRKHTPFFLKPWKNFYLFGRKTKNWIDLKFKKNKLASIIQKAYKDAKYA